MIEEVINNITSAENEAEEIVNIASKQAKDVRRNTNAKSSQSVLPKTSNAR